MNAGIDREGHDGPKIEVESAAETTTDTEVDADADADALDEGEWADTRYLLYDMVSTPSVSGDGEVAVGVLKAFFEAHDREIWIDGVGNICTPADDAVLLTSHVDTVPDDVPMKVEGGVFWGCGSIDATGPLCMMTVAAVEMGVSFVGVVGEEASSRGAWYLAEGREEPDAVVNGEPSGWDNVTPDYREFLSGTYASASELGRSSRPEENAAQSAVVWWSRVTDPFDEDRDGVFNTMTTKLTMFDGGPTEDGLAVEAMMDVQFRVPPWLSIDDIREVAESKLTRGDVYWNKPIPPVMVNPRTDVTRTLRVAIRNISGVRSRLLHRTRTSDVNIFVGAWDCPITTYGSGSSDPDHTPGEHFDLAEFDSTVDVLVDAHERLADN